MLSAAESNQLVSDSIYDISVTVGDAREEGFSPIEGALATIISPEGTEYNKDRYGNPLKKIRWSTPRRGRAKVKIINMGGQTMDETGWMDLGGPGFHEIDWSPRSKTGYAATGFTLAQILIKDVKGLHELGSKVGAVRENGSGFTNTDYLSPTDTMGIGDGIPTGPNIANVYIYLGEDAQNQLEGPFDILKPYLREMNDTVKDNAIDFINGELEDFIQQGLEGENRYQTNVYVGREPPLRYVTRANQTEGVQAKVGWHVILPWSGDFHAEEVNVDNKIY